MLLAWHNLNPDQQSWYLALGFGLLMVTIYSWGQFDEPSYVEKSKDFGIYKPKFTTSKSRYYQAKVGYLTLMIFILVGFSLAPQLLGAIGGSSIKDTAAFPLAFAVAITSLQNISGIREFERQLRGFLHNFARIPEGVRRTVSRLAGSEHEFDFGIYKDFLNSGRLGPHLVEGDLVDILNGVGDDLVRSRYHVGDDLVRSWYHVACILEVLSVENREKLDIDPLFFSYYEDELESIRDRHAVLGSEVREYIRRSSSPTQFDENLENLNKRMQDLRKRLYTFFVCGLRCSVQSEAEMRSTLAVKLNRMGFKRVEQVRTPTSIWLFIGFSVAVVSVATMATALAWWIFQKKITMSIEQQIALSVGTAVYCFSAIAATMASRATLIQKRKWCDLDDAASRRPFAKYPGPILSGAIIGMVTLTIIIFLTPFPAPKAAGDMRAIFDASPWIPLSMIISVLALWISDSDMRRRSFLVITGISLACGIIMSLTGAISALISGVLAATEGYVWDPAKNWPDIIFTSGCIGFFSFLLCGVLQWTEKSGQLKRDLTRKSLRAHYSRGATLIIDFAEVGQASLFLVDKDDVKIGASELAGDCQQLPEGTVVYWKAQPGGRDTEWGNLAVISADDESMMYEGYDTRISTPAKFTAQIYSVQRLAA